MRTFGKSRQIGFALFHRQKLSPRGSRPVLSPQIHRQTNIGFRDAAMRSGAGPLPSLWFGNQTRAHRIQLGVTQSFPQVHWIEWTRIEAALPGMTAGSVRSIPV